MTMPRPRPNPVRRNPAVQDAGGVVGSVSRFWQRSYAADYLGLVLLFAAYIVILLVIEPFHRMFSLDNIALQYPHATVERVPVFWNIVYAVALPLCIILLWALIFQPGFHKVQVTVLGLLISAMLATFLTDVIKNSVGRPRPDLISRCKPKKDTPKNELVTIDVCTETIHHVLHDGWRSFPSGHSSLAFSGLGFLAFFFAGQMHVFRPRTDLARVLLAFAPLMGAALIAMSRLQDYRHDVYDVLSGSALGMLVACFSYQRYYPRLRSSRCDQPYPSRAEQAVMHGAGKAKDEEAHLGGVEDYSGDSMEDEMERMPLRDTGKDRERLGGSRNVS